MMEQEHALINLTIYIVSLMYYGYVLSRDVIGDHSYVLRSTWIEKIKVVFLVIIGMLPVANTLMCIFIIIYKIIRNKEVKNSKYE